MYSNQNKESNKAINTYFAMEVVEHLTMVGVGVVVHVLQVPGEGMVQDHLVVEGVVGHHVDEGVDLGDLSNKPHIKRQYQHRTKGAIHNLQQLLPLQLA